ncbi:MAG: hypothetical protein JWL60_1067 [Gemmatimonadetes bacterium]|jgi:hypothetical protein|nr:hypothetical protein [Gemmatimonadota bacterium]
MQSPTAPDPIFGDAEPARDGALRAALGDVVGAPPVHEVDWDALAARIASARARHGAAWWSHVARWERRALPVALAAGLAGVLALWGLGMPGARAAAVVAALPADAVTMVVDGGSAADAAQSLAQSLTAVDELSVEAF